MRRRMLVLAPLAALVVAGCGGSSAKSSSPTASSSTTSTRAAGTPAATSQTTAASTPSAPFLSSLKTVSTVASTVPRSGDINPYGIATVPASAGKLVTGEMLISNFNDKANDQGTGNTIVQISPTGKHSIFSTIKATSLPGRCPGGVGLTTALSVLPGGFVVVGSLPTTNGKSATAQYGCLIVLDSSGKPVSTIAGPQIAGPWDMTAATRGDITNLFVSNVLNGGAARGKHILKNSTVVRIRVRSGAGHAPKVLGEQVIANKIPWRDDPNALVIGPTGVALSPGGTLYLADTLSNRIATIPQALTRSSAAADGGTTLTRAGKLNQPLGLILAPNGDLLATNAGNGEIVEISPTGKQLVTRIADRKTGAGSLFGLVLNAHRSGIFFVDDGDNTLKLLH